MRKSYVQKLIDGVPTLILKEDLDGVQLAPYVLPDLPDYLSPVTDKLVSGRKQRREDLKRTGCRPYEGHASERKAAQQYRKEREQKLIRSMVDRMRWINA